MDLELRTGNGLSVAAQGRLAGYRCLSTYLSRDIKLPSVTGLFDSVEDSTKPHPAISNFSSVPTSASDCCLEL
jgi:hypothetical protein